MSFKEFSVSYPFSTNVPPPCPLKTLKDLRFSVFRGYRGGKLVEKLIKYEKRKGKNERDFIHKRKTF